VGPAEPLSPELVLVCPELREQALAAASPLPWEGFGTWRADRVRPLGTECEAEPESGGRLRVVREALLYVSGIAVQLVTVGVVVSLLTLLLTAIGGAR
jgi:hypothetical protein